jgi:CheY-like chemotaxis protein
MLVLYAEDDPEDVEVFGEALKEINPSIVFQSVKDGSEVIPFLENSVLLPNYIFLDVNMPVVSGRDCIIQLKNNSKYKTIPVVIYTTSNREEDRKDLINLGAAQYIIKPNTYTEIYTCLKSAMKTEPMVLRNSNGRNHASQ